MPFHLFNYLLHIGLFSVVTVFWFNEFTMVRLETAESELMSLSVRTCGGFWNRHHDRCNGRHHHQKVHAQSDLGSFPDSDVILPADVGDHSFEPLRCAVIAAQGCKDRSRDGHPEGGSQRGCHLIDT